MVAESRFDLVGRIQKFDSTPQGGLKIPAFVTRAGVFAYTRPDGSVQRELRHPDDVFRADSLATLAGAPLTVGHPGEVNPGNWQSNAAGHLGDSVRRDGRFVAADIRVQTASAVAGVQKGDLVELSCGYSCDVTPSRGTYDGEEYDAIQTNIKYNHVAIGGKNWGRAGGEVKLRLDSPYTDMVMPTDPNPTPVAAATPAPAADPLVFALARADRLQGELDGLRARFDSQTRELAEARDPARVEALVVRLTKMREDAARVLGAGPVPSTEREIMIAVVTKVDSSFRADANTSADYLRGRYEAAVSSPPIAAAASVQTAVAAAIVQDSASPVEVARNKYLERCANAWKGSK